MSIVADQVRRVDGQLDRVQLDPRPTHDGDLAAAASHNVSSPPQITELQHIIKALSTTSFPNPLLSPWRISTLLQQAAFSEVIVETDDELSSTYKEELEWLLVGKATVQTYGLLLNLLLEQTIPLNDQIWYWEEVLGSYPYSSLYTIQTSPVRFWTWSKDIYHDTKDRLAVIRELPADALSAKEIGMGLTDRWKQFYGLVQESIQKRSMADLQRRVLSPIALCRAQARQNLLQLKRLREMSASGLGVLMDEGLNFGINEEYSEVAKTEESSREWKVVVERSIALMDTVLRNITSLGIGVSDFEDTVFSSVEDDGEVSVQSDDPEAPRPARLARRLQHILQARMPNHLASSQKLVSQYGRPSRLVRYWLPTGVLLLSSTTILRLLVNRKAEIIQWVEDFGVTLRDFWFNWVVEPTKKVIGTIRHDKDSAIAIMSKESLKGDRDSLERMVVDFAIDRPQTADAGGGPLSKAQISEIAAKVKEGDLTPVLLAYEKDLRKPLLGTVRGDLIRTLLIQIQKTKVDVQVAMNGIDSLLKSQELVFGFVGLTPGILVCFATARYLHEVFGSKRGLQKGQKAGQSLRMLRNIDRTLSLAPAQNNVLPYKDHGLLLCEVHVLRGIAHRLLPGDVEREFLEDVADMCNINTGVQQQIKTLDRIRWSYARWFR